MSQFKDLYEYTAQNPLKESLARFRKGYENQVAPIILIPQFILEPISYTIRFTNTVSIKVLFNQPSKIVAEIVDNKVSISYFEKLVDTINSNGSNIDV